MSLIDLQDDACLTISQLAKILNVHVVTIRNWERDGNSPLPVHRTQGNQRRYLGKDIKQYLGITSDSPNIQIENNKKTILYARVSSHDQKSDLNTQIELLSLYASSQGFQYEVLSEIFSGLNFKRPKFNLLLKMIENNEVERIIINHKDRLMRFGYEMFESICKMHNVQIIVLDQSNKELEKELLDDFISLITSFSGKIYGKKSHKNKKIIEMLKDTAMEQVESQSCN